jgi:hypothetical protein
MKRALVEIDVVGINAERVLSVGAQERHMELVARPEDDGVDLFRTPVREAHRLSLDRADPGFGDEAPFRHERQEMLAQGGASFKHILRRLRGAALFGASAGPRDELLECLDHDCPRERRFGQGSEAREKQVIRRHACEEFVQDVPLAPVA